MIKYMNEFIYFNATGLYFGVEKIDFMWVIVGFEDKSRDGDLHGTIFLRWRRIDVSNLSINIYVLGNYTICYLTYLKVKVKVSKFYALHMNKILLSLMNYYNCSQNKILIIS